MENVKPFLDRDIVGICAYLSKYCELYINAHGADLNRSEVKTFHVFFPKLLMYIFGSPTYKGWIQSETNASQDAAIKEFLSINGQFFRALVKLSHHLENYSVELLNESLASDVKGLLSSGSIHSLPRVYQGCSHIVKRSDTGEADIRQAATRQSSLPASTGGDRKIKFNMLQFYLYYFVSVATWAPLSPAPQQAAQQQSTLSNMNKTVYAAGSSIPHSQSKPVHNGAVRQPSFTSTTYGTQQQQQQSTNSNIPQHQFPGALRPITYSVYDTVLEEYLTQFIPINSSSNNTFLPDIGSFFLDACLELWIRTQWVTVNNKLSAEYMHYVKTFTKYFVRHDLKQCTMTDENPTAATTTNPPLITQVYRLVKEELYLLISRLAINWSKHDDYQQVIELWCIWAAPWKMGSQPRTAEKTEYNPVQSGWSLFIVDNLPYYFTLVDIFLQRTLTFQYKDSIQTQPGVPLSNYSDTGTINGQLRILYRLINVLKANGLVDYLAQVELGFLKIQQAVGSATSPALIAQFKKAAQLTYGSESKDHVIFQKMNQVYDVLKMLDGVGGAWKPKGLYATEIQPRSENLIKTLVALNTGTTMREGKGWGVSISAVATSAEKNARNAAQLKEAYDQLHRVFKMNGQGHLNLSTTTTTDSRTTTTAGMQSTRSTTAMAIGSSVKKTQWITPTYVGTQNNGYLTSEDRRRIAQGKALCSHDHIRPVGERATTYVRSYESPLLVRWIVQIDKKANGPYARYRKHIAAWLPDWLLAWFPERLTLRCLARMVNFVYTVAALLLFLYLLFKLIF